MTEITGLRIQENRVERKNQFKRSIEHPRHSSSQYFHTILFSESFISSFRSSWFHLGLLLEFKVSRTGCTIKSWPSTYDPLLHHHLQILVSLTLARYSLPKSMVNMTSPFGSFSSSSSWFEASSSSTASLEINIVNPFSCECGADAITFKRVYVVVA